MAKQKVCIIGGSLSGLITAITLSKLNLSVDLISNNFNEKINQVRTTAISQSNYEFLKKLNILNQSQNSFWSCAEIKLYDSLTGHNFKEALNINNEFIPKQNMLYIIKNEVMIRFFKEKIRANKNIKIKNNTKILNLDKFVSKKNNTNYNLVIICTGPESNLAKKYLSKKYFDHSYEEISITAIISHKSLKNRTARQFFLDEGPLAFLPISNNKTSIVWSIKNKIVKNEKNLKLLLNNKVNEISNKFLKNIKIESKIESKYLNFRVSQKYYLDRILFFGDILHLVHPMAGQGFNMALRDLNNLEKLLKNKLRLGLDIGSSDILSEFYNLRKTNNLIHSLGIDFVRTIFNNQTKTFRAFRNKTLNHLNKNELAKKIFVNIADTGINL